MGKIKVIGNAIDDGFRITLARPEARKILNLPGEGILVGTAGELSRKRGVDILIKAFNILISRSKDYYLILAGKLEQGLLPEDMENILYLGELEYKTIPELFRALDVGVICNFDDEFGKYCHPQKACEMIACRLPVVAANVGYLSRVFKYTPKLLFTPGDHEDLVNSIIYQANQKIISRFPVKTWYQRAQSLKRLLATVVKS